ncbi:MAG: class II fructose-bisphosphate aldolase [Candidatus Helarchaeota archaeon]|nr:class II fructose-bisphosphate aldolase [Candidatus Helarchaeota archaeon]
MTKYEAIPGSEVYSALKDQSSIILACNPRINIGILDGLFEAAKKMNSIIVMELAKSESNLSGGYTGLTPEMFAKNVKDAAERADWPWFIIHGDHLTMRKVPEDVNIVKELILSQIKHGYSSFAIDASFLFNHEGKNTREELEKNIELTTEIAHFIKSNMKGKEFGLEVEVGEIGKKDEHGLVLTTVDEAVTFINALKENDVNPNLLAIANGSSHGNIYDEAGNPIEQISINIPRTIEIGKAIEKFGVRIAQHGITGTPLNLIATDFPKGEIGKGNVGTYWMNIAWDVLKVFKPDLFKKIWDWVINYKQSKEKLIQVFGKNSKYAIKQFFNEIYAVDDDTRESLKAISYSEALKFLRAFNSKNTVNHLKR